MLERTLLLIKPDGVSRGLENEIFSRVEQAGLKVVKKRKVEMTKELADDLYSPHLGKPFYSGLIKFITIGPVICSIVEGEKAVDKVRALMGATDPREAKAGTIRGDFKEQNIYTLEGTIKNIVHGSDSLESAEREIAVFFKEEV